MPQAKLNPTTPSPLTRDLKALFPFPKPPALRRSRPLRSHLVSNKPVPHLVPVGRGLGTPPKEVIPTDLDRIVTRAIIQLDGPCDKAAPRRQSSSATEDQVSSVPEEDLIDLDNISSQRGAKSGDQTPANNRQTQGRFSFAYSCSTISIPPVSLISVTDDYFSNLRLQSSAVDHSQTHSDFLRIQDLGGYLYYPEGAIR